ncbi:alpha/beta hydrolase [uncultured Veillonella sp.]|uniref:alpha/beta hydrolase n=1 Tax=uncultured Veillonella sp. TaxID=159268 RepID=UPI0025DD3214|nr:alpha/beta hydrolase [uncultured Veillonella sp.]
MKSSIKMMKKAMVMAAVAALYGASGGFTVQAADAQIPAFVPVASNAARIAEAEQHVMPTTNSQDTINSPMNQPEQLKLTQEWDKVFPKSDKVEHKKVTFVNRYGITLAGDLYIPKNANGKMPAIAVSGPFGAVKEQVSGLYAQTLAEQGFITVAFDPSYTGESGGAPRNMASPDINTEDFSAAVDFLGSLEQVDRQNIGLMGICGFGGMALSDAAMDKRVKAVATSVLYDMSRSIGQGLNDSYTAADRDKVLNYLADKRWEMVDRGTTAPGYHEVPIVNGNLITLEDGHLLPEVAPANMDPVGKQFFDYYRTGRGYHPRSINSTTAWVDVMPYGFMNFSMNGHLDEIAPRPVLLVTGSEAHSKYMSEDVMKSLVGDNKEIIIVPGANHVDFYDRTDVIPFEAITAFFHKNLK